MGTILERTVPSLHTGIRKFGPTLRLRTPVESIKKMSLEVRNSQDLDERYRYFVLTYRMYDILKHVKR